MELVNIGFDMDTLDMGCYAQKLLHHDDNHRSLETDKKLDQKTCCRRHAK